MTVAAVVETRVAAVELLVERLAAAPSLGK